MNAVIELPTWTTYSSFDNVQTPVLITQKYLEVPLGELMVPTSLNDDIIRFQVDYDQQLTYIALPFYI